MEQPSDTTSRIRGALQPNWSSPNTDIPLPASLSTFIAKGLVPVDIASGDLNADDIPDLAVVTGKPQEDMLQFKNYDLPRHLLVFLGQKEGGYRFLFRNEKAIPCINCCGMSDPYGGMSIKKGRFTINEYCASNWKSISEHRFSYVPRLGDWLLDTVVTETYAFDYEHYNLDTTTKKDFGRVSLKTFVMYKDED